MPQHGQEATFHVDHIIPRRQAGATTLDNLALACVSCSLRKGARTHVHRPDNGVDVPLFHPRQQAWNEHFVLAEDGFLMSSTVTGSATIAALAMNRATAVEIRRELMQVGRWS